MKKHILTIILESIFIIVFNTIFFMTAGSEHTSTVWVSYFAIHSSYILLLVTPLLVKKGYYDYAYYLPLYFISAIYFIIELLLGTIFIICNIDSFNLVFITHLVITGGYAIFLIINLLANDATAKEISKQKQEIYFIKNSSSKIKLLINISKNENLYKPLENLYDIIHSSPTKSLKQVIELENTITTKIKNLEENIYNENAVILIEEIILLVKERNETIKLQY